MRRKVEAYSVREAVSDVLDAMMGDTNRCAAVFEEVTTSGSDASFQIIEEYILSDQWYGDSTLVEKAGRRMRLSDFGRKVVDSAGRRLYDRVFKAQSLLENW